jgi:hypothetical protein
MCIKDQQENRNHKMFKIEKNNYSEWVVELMKELEDNQELVGQFRNWYLQEAAAILCHGW